MVENKILVLTSISPNPFNEGGHPSGLIWEVIEYLKRHNIVCDTDVIEDTSSKPIKRLHQYGIAYINKYERAKDYAAILVYPENLLFCVPKRLRSRCIVLGPDSPSLRDARLYKHAPGHIFRYIRLLMYLLSIVHEYRLIKESYYTLVVGRTDQLWMRLFNRRIRKSGDCSKILFLRHPYLSKVVFPSADLTMKVNFTSQENVRFIFSGLINERYTRTFIERVVENLDIHQPLHFVITGKRNKWLAELLNSKSSWIVEYYDWVENYRDLCQIGRDIHCLPDRVGAGTKNRALTALVNGVEIISTPIGIENIQYSSVKGVYIAHSAKQYAAYMMTLFMNHRSSDSVENIIESRKKLRNAIMDSYESGMNFVINKIGALFFNR